MVYEELTLRTEDGCRVHAWFIPVSDERATAGVTVLMCHGNSGNISHRLERVVAMHRQLGVDVLLFDYRGFGKSTGRPTEAGTHHDALAAYRYLTDQRALSASRIVLLGESLGAAVALSLEAVVEVAGIVLEAPFESIPAMARHLFPFVPDGWVRTRYDNLDKVSRVAIPLLVVHGTADKTVPFGQGRSVFEAAPEPKTFLTIPEGGHADAYAVGGQDYWNAWRALIGEP